MNKAGTEANYLGATLPHCDFCQAAGLKVQAVYDAASKQGPWGYMCERHFTQHGMGLGLGRGQRLVLKAP